MMEWNNAIWVYCEIVNGALSPVSIELLGKGRELADVRQTSLVAVVLGKDAEPIAKTAVSYGADGAIIVPQPEWTSFDAVRYTHAMAVLVKKYMPNVILIGASNGGRDLGGRLSAAMNVGLVADCIDVYYDGEGDTLTWIRPAYTGKLFVKIQTTTRPQLATVSDKIFRGNAPDASRQGHIVTETVAGSDVASSYQVTHVEPLPPEALDINLEHAEIIVGAGRGVGDEAGMQKVQTFAEAIGAAFGVSKPLVDNGWAAHDIQIGITGKKIAPKIYIALGISGAIQHKLGIQDAELIIAVNKDPDAPIFQFSHYGIVGDLFEALPALEEEFKRLKK